VLEALSVPLPLLLLLLLSAGCDGPPLPLGLAVLAVLPPSLLPAHPAVNAIATPMASAIAVIFLIIRMPHPFFSFVVPIGRIDDCSLILPMPAMEF